MNLTNGKKNKIYKIIKIDGELKIKRRLLDLGFVVGEKLQILQISPLKKTYLITIKNYVLALRENTAKLLQVDEVK